MNPYFTKTQFYDYTILSGPLLAPLRYNREVGSRDYTLWVHCYTRPSSKRRDSRGGLGSIPTREPLHTPSYCLEACNQYENMISVSKTSYKNSFEGCSLLIYEPEPFFNPKLGRVVSNVEGNCLNLGLKKGSGSFITITDPNFGTTLPENFQIPLTWLSPYKLWSGINN